MDKTCDISSMNTLGASNMDNDEFTAMMNDLNDDLLRTRLD